MTLLDHTGGLSIFPQFVLIPLSFDPVDQSHVLMPMVWNTAVPVVLFEVDKLLESFLPLISFASSSLLEIASSTAVRRCILDTSILLLTAGDFSGSTRGTRCKRIFFALLMLLLLQNIHTMVVGEKAIVVRFACCDRCGPLVPLLSHRCSL